MFKLNRAEKRLFHRVSVASGARLIVDEQEHKGTVVDISLNGLMIALDEHWQGPIGVTGVVQIDMPDNPSHHIMMHVEIARCSEKHLGCECISIDFQSAKRLKQLMIQSDCDETLLSREFSLLVEKYF